MKRFSANTLDAALIEATKHFDCSLTQIEYEVIQNPSSGFLGFLKKEAIIVATKKHNINTANTESTKPLETNIDSMNSTTSLNTETTQDTKEASATISAIDSKDSKINTSDNSLSNNKHIENTENNNQTDLNAKEYTSKESKDSDESDETPTKHTFIAKDLQTNKDNNTKAYANESKADTLNKGPQESKAQEFKTKESQILESQITKPKTTEIKTKESSITDSKPTQTHANTKEIKQDTSIPHKKSIDERVQGDFDSTFYDKDSNVAWQDSTQSNAEQKKDIESICKEVQDELTELLSYLPLKLNKIHVEPYDDHTLFILIDGLDAALLIGQKGYRYKSLSYLLFNWIHTCYGLGVRLEIAQFLKNQEEMMRAYLGPIIENAKVNGKAQTKPLDGVLTHIALKMLRDALPNKYIVFRENADGEKYISISEFISNNNMRNNIHGFGNLPKY